ncbi:MAG: hypothetical protein AAF078_14085, partial [Planctomycetota bacterium]
MARTDTQKGTAAVAKKKTPAKKAVAKKTAKKAAAGKPVAKKPTTKKVPAKRTAPTKPASQAEPHRVRIQFLFFRPIFPLWLEHDAVISGTREGSEIES